MQLRQNFQAYEHCKANFRHMNYNEGNGMGLHMEYEAGLSKSDLLRFCGYHVDLIGTYEIDFHTVIFTRKTPTLTKLNYAELKFAPTVISCDSFDGDKVVNRLESDIADGNEIIKRHSRGEGAMDISKATNVSLKEVEHIIAKFKS